MRDYDPTTGRYLQADPLGLVDGASVYGYARQSTLVWTDKTGQCPWCAAVVVSAAIGLALDLTIQLYELDGQWECIDWWQAGRSAVIGGAFGGAGRYAWFGYELKIGSNFRVAPFGNRGGFGRTPHYHRRGVGPGQGIGRHRPWQRSQHDRGFWDRF
jgi:uncharacterized protein RhaS with RHS repeats